VKRSGNGDRSQVREASSTRRRVGGNGFETKSCLDAELERAATRAMRSWTRNGRSQVSARWHSN